MPTNSERVALVTGASRGIGATIARVLAARGCRIALQYRDNRAAAELVAETLPGAGHTLHAADLAKAGGPEALWKAVSGAMGRVDILVNNAGVYFHHPPFEVGPDEWRRAWRETIEANLFAPAELSYLAARAMALRTATDPVFGRGRIVNISSRGAFRGEPHGPAYGASKAGLNALSQSLAKAGADRGVYVYVVAPGWVTTDMAAEHLRGPEGPAIIEQHPLDRVTSPEEVAEAVAFCALDAPAAMTGAILDVNGASYLRT